MASVGSADLLIVPKFNNLTTQITSALNGASSSASSSGSKLGQATSTGFGKGLLTSGAAIGAFSSLTSTAMSAISSHVSSAISRFDTLNNYPRTMQNLGYGASEAEASISKMSDRLSTLPTTLDSMVSTVQGIAVITGDLDQATEAGLALNDMLIAGGGSTQMVTAAAEQFRQMLSKGKPELQDWKSLVQAAPGQLDQLAKSMLGTTATADDLYAALGGGKNEQIISMDELINEMIKLDTEGGGAFASFQEQAETAAGGVETSMANAGNAITKGLAGTLDAIGTDTISGVFNDMKGAINGAFGVFNSMVGKAAPIAKDFYENAKEIAPTIAAIGVSYAAIKTGASVFGGVTTVVGDLSAALSLASEAGTGLGGAIELLGVSLNPVALGIAAVSAAVGIGVSLWSDYAEKQANMTAATEGLNDAVSRSDGLSDYSAKIGDVGTAAGESAKTVDELAESTAKAVEKMNENTASAEEQIAQLNTAQGIIAECAGQTDLSTAAQGRLTWALSLLNEQLGTNITAEEVMAGQYTDENGEVQNLKQSIDELVESKKNEARMAAITENLTLAYEQQSEAAATLTQAQRDYNTAVQAWMDENPQYTKAQAEEAVNRQEAGKALSDAREQYDDCTNAVNKFSEQLGDAATAESDAASDMLKLVNSMPLLTEGLSLSGSSVTDLADDLEGLSVSTEDVSNLTTEQLTQLANDYDGTKASIVDDLAEWNIAMDENAQKSAEASSAIRDALNGLGDEAATAFEGTGINVDTFADKLSEAGLTADDLAGLTAGDFAAMAEACNGNVNQMVGMIGMYNSTEMIDKDGNVNINDAALLDAQGNLYTWNGSTLVDQNGNAIVDDTELLDAQNNVWTWNGTTLQHKGSDATIDTSSLDSGKGKVDNWNNNVHIGNKSGTVTITGIINGATSAVKKFFGWNAAGGIRLHADGGIRYHAGGAIATRAVPLDIVGEDGAEAIVPLTNRKYSQPFADILADGILGKFGEAGGKTIVQNFTTKVVRSDADLYSAAAILNNSALRAAGV